MTPAAGGPLSSRAVPAPALNEDVVLLSLRDRGYRRVELVHELRQPRTIPFHRRGPSWQLQLEQPPVHRFEYLLELEHRDGRVERVPDPGNPRRARGAFGEKSVLEFTGYEPPDWVGDEESQTGDLRELTLPSRLLRTETAALLWSAAETDPLAELPLLLVHDGPDYARFSEVLRLFDHLVAFAEVPPFRAALVPPPLDRNETYSASARYARALAEEWLPALASEIADGLGAWFGRWRQGAELEYLGFVPPNGIGASLQAGPIDAGYLLLHLVERPR